MIVELLWPNDRIDHIARHDIAPDALEEVCFVNPARFGIRHRNRMDCMIVQPDEIGGAETQSA